MLIADEAHRTAGLRRNSKIEKRLRDFTICHDQGLFPARFRVYQTATPRVYDTSRRQPADDAWVVRNMDDESTFGVELYRKSYMEAVTNGWLTDYRIIALGVNDSKAHDAANELARKYGKSKTLTTTHFLRGLTLALVMGGATRAEGAPVKSCIGFMNTVHKSKEMAKQLQSESVRNWVQDWLTENRNGREAAKFTLQHLDAKSSVSAREDAIARLGTAAMEEPHGIINVGIFGEGTDAPSLSAVAFLEARKSPIDVIQAVGRAMRLSEGKELGYIICPIVVPQNIDAEHWLMTSGPNDGWQELGQILLALRAHDSRIEDELASLLELYVPPSPVRVSTMIAVVGENGRISYHGHSGPPGKAPSDVTDLLEGRVKKSDVLSPLSKFETQTLLNGRGNSGSKTFIDPEGQGTEPTESDAERKHAAPDTMITGKKNKDGSCELRTDSTFRDKPKADGTPGPINIPKSKEKARNMINKGHGQKLLPKPRRTSKEVNEQRATRLLDLSLAKHGLEITANLLSKSGLRRDRVARDLNLLEDAVTEAARHLREDGANAVLDRHFGLHNLKQSKKKRADGCVIGSLLMMNAAMLHQRISNGRWLTGVKDLAELKNEAAVVKLIARQWHSISKHDFLPNLDPAIEVIEAIEDAGRLAGLERALRHLAREAERIAEIYADMGADHAGPLFNRVMGDQASDGAYFTRPVAASIAARLALDMCGARDWTDPGTWREHKTVDLACGSGTLLVAMMTDMKRRAREQGANEVAISKLQKLGVEEVFKGLDINPISLQLAASQLTAGNQNIRYRKMGLHLMPYGLRSDNSVQASAGSLELLGQRAIVGRGKELDPEDVKIKSQAVQIREDDPELEDAVDAVEGARIVVMNAPFTNRTKMGEKFEKEVQSSLRTRVDRLEATLVLSDEGLRGFADKNSIRPQFVALADKCLNGSEGLLVMVQPTIALTTTSGQREREVLAKRYCIDTILTCHLPGQVNMSQNTGINESIVLACRRHGSPPTRIINLDRMPLDEKEVADLHRCLSDCRSGPIAYGWGEVSEWPARRIEAGDWTAAIWRSPLLAEEAATIADDGQLRSLKEMGFEPAATGQQLRSKRYEQSETGVAGSFPVIKSKGAEGQKTIRSQPDEYWICKSLTKGQSFDKLPDGGTTRRAGILHKAGKLLITAGQNNSTARLSATADAEAYVGYGWLPVRGMTSVEAKAIAVFLNSTAGRLQLMRNPGSSLVFPTYSAAQVRILKVPDVTNGAAIRVLADCWERTKDMVVPQYRDGECEVRVLWDKAVCEALDWPQARMNENRALLHNEPHVRGLGYGQYADEPESKSGKS